MQRFSRVAHIFKKFELYLKKFMWFFSCLKFFVAQNFPCFMIILLLKFFHTYLSTGGVQGRTYLVKQWAALTTHSGDKMAPPQWMELWSWTIHGMWSGSNPLLFLSSDWNLMFGNADVRQEPVSYTHLTLPTICSV